MGCHNVEPMHHFVHDKIKQLINTRVAYYGGSQSDLGHIYEPICL